MSLAFFWKLSGLAICWHEVDVICMKGVQFLAQEKQCFPSSRWHVDNISKIYTSTRGVFLDIDMKSIRIYASDLATVFLKSSNETFARRSYSTQLVELRREDAQERFSELAT